MTTATPPAAAEHTTLFNRHQMTAMLCCLALLAVTNPNVVVPVPLMIGTVYLWCALWRPR